jgi:hypothetical protein
VTQQPDPARDQQPPQPPADPTLPPADPTLPPPGPYVPLSGPYLPPTPGPYPSPAPGSYPPPPGPYVPGQLPVQSQIPPAAPSVMAPDAAANRRTNIIILSVVGGALGLLILICVVGVLAFDSVGGKEPTSNAAGPVTATPPATEPTTTASQPAAEPTTSAPPTTRILPADKKFAGRGSKVIKLSLPAGYQHIAKITYRGTGNFVVWAVDSRGAEQGLLVNDIGSYAGTRPVDPWGDDKPAALRVQASGGWTITIQVAQKAPRWNGKGSGKGAAVLLVDPSVSQGMTTVRITHSGKENFAVWAISDYPNLLVNEIGRFNGETLLPDGTVMLDIQADGRWTVTRI